MVNPIIISSAESSIGRPPLRPCLTITRSNPTDSLTSLLVGERWHTIQCAQPACVPATRSSSFHHPVPLPIYHQCSAKPLRICSATHLADPAVGPLSGSSTASPTNRVLHVAPSLSPAFALRTIPSSSIPTQASATADASLQDKQKESLN
ncbi:hypothetical protein BDZ89DRAFT_1145958 [Hymenopellis radicata]|nr:hypothetical protein BDZ89DRAFT_1145958 [Hymenopellis radicata]